MSAMTAPPKPPPVMRARRLVQDDVAGAFGVERRVLAVLVRPRGDLLLGPDFHNLALVREFRLSLQEIVEMRFVVSSLMSDGMS